MDLEMISSVRAVKITAFSCTKHSLIMITQNITRGAEGFISGAYIFFYQMIVMAWTTRRTVMNDIICSIFLFAFKENEAGINQTSSCTHVVSTLRKRR